MNNNDLLRRLRYALRCDDAETARLVIEGGGIANASMAAGWRIKENEPGHIACTQQQVSAFLSGLILDRRGPPEQSASSNPWDQAKANKAKKNAVAKSVESPAAQDASTTKQNDAGQQVAPDEMDNNQVLKQLRIALKLRSDELHGILQAGGSSLTKSEANALFRSDTARNYRRCGDQVLRQFLSGLAKQRDEGQ